LLAARHNQSYTLPARESQDFWRDLQDQTLLYGPGLDIGFEIPFDNVSAYASAMQPVAESSLEVMRSFFGLTSPATPESLDVDHLKIMTSFLPKLEVDVPEFSVEEFKQKWEMLSWSSYTNTILYFLELAVYLLSNNMLQSHQKNAVFQWLVNERNQLALDALVSSRMPTAQAFIHEMFKCAYETVICTLRGL
jgi:hypothetical protein